MFSRNDLPILGVTWRWFDNKRDAILFAQFAENETQHDEYPCEAFLMRDEFSGSQGQWEVKVRNW
jgi:hypothetical protein